MQASIHDPTLPAPDYWTRACDHLIQRDRILRKLIPRYRHECLQMNSSPYQTLVRIIVGQQISLALGRKLWARLTQACNADIHPGCIARFDEAQLRNLGLSRRKANYVRDASTYFSQPGRMEASWWHGLDNATVVAQLCSIRGVGRWSAEMFLIFFLGRPDVLPLDDRTLLKAISHHYFSGEPVSRFEAREVAQAWAPWRTVASWYLWRSLDAASVDY